jgi:hypothetical protein
MADGLQNEGSTVTTRPDPTERVNQSIKDAVSAAREVIEAKLDKNYEIYHERFRSFDQQYQNTKTIAEERVRNIGEEIIRLRNEIVSKNEVSQRWLAQDNIVKIMKETSDERLKMIFDKIKENTENITDKIKDNQATAKAAVEAAFSAANAANAAAFAAAGAAADKQEKSFIKLLDTLGATVTDLKDRIVVMEGKNSVADPTTMAAITSMSHNIDVLKESRDLTAGRSQQTETSTGTWIAIIAALAALALVVVDFAGVLKNYPH